MTDQTPTITVTGQSVTLDVTGQPDVSNKYGSGQIRPRFVRLDYQDTAIHAQVYGCWVREDGELTDAPVDQDYVARTGDVRDWPDWLAAVAYLAKGAAPAVVSPALPASTDQATEIAQLREKYTAGLRRADEINNALMEEVQRYAAGTEHPVLWSVYNEMHKRALNAEAEVERLRRLADETPTTEA